MARIDSPLALWVDDCKPCPDGFAVARTYDDALSLCRRYRYTVIHLDYDLGEQRTGLDLLRQLDRERLLPPLVELITWNPVGRKRLEAELRDIDRRRQR